MTNGNSMENEDEDDYVLYLEPIGNMNTSKCSTRLSVLTNSSVPSAMVIRPSSSLTCWSRSVLITLLVLLVHFCCLEVLATDTTTTIIPLDQAHFTTVASLNSAMLNLDDMQVDDYTPNVTLSLLRLASNATNDSLESEAEPIRTTADPEYVYFRTTVRFWVQRVMVPVIMLVGIVGNSITMVIMTRRRMRSSTNWYLAALAIFDMIYLIFTFILSLKHYPNAHDVDYYLYWYMIPFSMMITDASSNTSVWLTVTFTIERYIAVCHPIKGKVICTESRAKKVILCVFIICVSVTVPTPFEWIVLEGIDAKTNKTRMEAVFSELGRNETYKSIYYHLNVFLFVLLPLILLVIFNSFLIRSVHISTKQRSKMVMGKDSPYQKNDNSSSPSSSRQEIRITIMLIAVVILFIICQTPTACILVYTVFHSPGQNSNEEYLLTGLSNIFNFLMSINAAGNFVLYCLLSQKYRRTFVNMFCPCLVPKYLRSQSTYPRVNVDSVAPVHSVHQTHPHTHAHIHHHRFNDSKRNGTSTTTTVPVTNHVTTNNYRATSTSSSSISTNHDSGTGTHHHRNHQPHSRHSPSSSIKFRSFDRDYLPKNGAEVKDQSHILLLDSNGSHHTPQLVNNANNEHRLISASSSVDN